MPMIDVHLPERLLPAEAIPQLAERLTHALLRWEGNPVAPPYSEHTVAFIQELPAGAIHTAADGPVAAVRIHVTTPPGALSREGQLGFVEEATSVVTELADDPALALRTWVILNEAVDGGWGIAGFALGSAEFAALRGT